ncbi:MAG: Mov34/MPN/PAD-1 family protein [Vulcanimicrobiota bacterium]
MPASSLDSLREAARAAYPGEACGFLVGEEEVEQVWPAENLALEGYRIEDEEHLRAQLRARRLGKRILGYYHSHPDGMAVPSQSDHERAWPDLIYLIIPVWGGCPGTPRAFRLEKGWLTPCILPALETE